MVVDSKSKADSVLLHHIYLVKSEPYYSVDVSKSF